MSPKTSSHVDPFASSDSEVEAQLPQIIRRLEIITRRRVESLFAGAYQAVFQGQGMVFSDVRPYQPGDEVRWIDWNVSARMDELYIKQFIEERERTVMIVWDASRSMLLGQHRRSKRELSAELAMLLAMSAIQSGDRVGLIIFSHKVERYIAPQRGRKHVMRMLQILLEFQPSPEHSHTDIKEALLFLKRVSPRHSIAFIMSDFIAPHEEGVWQMLIKQCDCIPIMLTAPLEKALPKAPTKQPPKDPTLLESNDIETPNDQKVAETAPPSRTFTDQATGWPGALVLSTLFLTLGLWQGDMWLWSGGTAALICLMTTFIMQKQEPDAIYFIQDLERQNYHSVDLHRTKTKRDYEQNSQERRIQLKDRFRRLQMEILELSTEEDYLPELLRFFRQRQRRNH